MQINPTSWHYRLYVFNKQLINAWCGKSFYYEEPDATMIGLCPYMRTILLWGPLVMATYAIPLGALFGTFFYMPFATAGWQAILITIFGFVGGVAVLAGILYCMAVYFNWSEKRSDDARQARIERELNGLPEPETGWTVFKAYIVGIKTKICPVLEVQKVKTDDE